MSIATLSDREALSAAPVSLLESDDPAFWSNLSDYAAGNLFTSRPWNLAISNTYGFTVAASLRRRHGRVTAALMFVRVHDLRGERLVSVPFSDYCDPLADEEDWNDLVEPLLRQRVPLYLRCLHSNMPATDRRFVVTGKAAWHGIELTMPEDESWARLSSNARNAIRKAWNHGVVVREGTTLDDLRIFYDMHCHVRKVKYRLLPPPFALFEHLHAAFADQGGLVVLIAEQDGRPLAASVWIQWADRLYYKYSASFERGYSPNDLEIWEGIRAGQRRGLRLVDLGVSDLDQPGLLRFKRKYATEEREIVRYRYAPPGYDDSARNRADRVLQSLTQLLTEPDVPDPITRQAGERFYGLFC